MFFGVAGCCASTYTPFSSHFKSAGKTHKGELPNKVNGKIDGETVNQSAVQENPRGFSLTMMILVRCGQQQQRTESVSKDKKKVIFV